MDLKLGYHDVTRNRISQRLMLSSLTSFHWLAHIIFLACWPVWEKWKEEDEESAFPESKPATTTHDTASDQFNVERAVKAMRDALDLSNPPK